MENKTYYYVICEWGNPPEPHMLQETTDLDEARRGATAQMTGIGAEDNNAYVVLRDEWDHGIKRPL